MGVICLQAAILGLILPETKGLATLETMEDMNKDQRGIILVKCDGKKDGNENENEL